MVLGRDKYINLDGIKNKRMRIEKDSNLRPWSELPGDLLDLIVTRLGVVDFLLFACVCRSWRSCAAACKQEFMANQPPLLFLMSSHAKRSCYFYSIFHQRLYKRTLPNLVGKRCIGLSCGYLIMEDKAVMGRRERIPDSQLFLMNPFTGHELNIPSPPQSYSSMTLLSCITPYPQFMLIAISARFFLQFRRYGDDNWTVIDYRSERESWIEDVAVFKGKAYIVTNDAKIGVLNLNSQPYVTMLAVEGNFASRHFLRSPKLVASDEQLLMVGHRLSDEIVVFQLDFLGMEWKRVNSLEDHALFFGVYLKCCGLVNRSAMRGKINGIYYLDFWSHKYCIQSVDGKIVRHFPNTPKKRKPDISINTQLWYFPHLSFSVDSVF